MRLMIVLVNQTFISYLRFNFVNVMCTLAVQTCTYVDYCLRNMLCTLMYYSMFNRMCFNDNFWYNKNVFYFKYNISFYVLFYFFIFL